MSREDRQRDMSLDDVHQQDCLQTLAEVREKSGFQVHAYLRGIEANDMSPCASVVQSRQDFIGARARLMVHPDSRN